MRGAERTKDRLRRVLIAGVVVMAGGPAASADAYTFAPGYAGADFATGFPTGVPMGFTEPVGPWGLEFDREGTLFVADRPTRELYAFGPAGGLADASTRRGTLDEYLAADLAFDRAGRLYTARSGPSTWDIVEVSPRDAHVIRTVVALTSDQYVKGMRIDPLGGDLFVLLFDGPTGTSSVQRVTLPATGPGEMTPYAAFPGSNQVDGLVFTRGGTMFANSNDDIYRIDGTDRPQPATVTKVATVPNGDGMAVDQTTDPLDPAYILVNRNDGRITRVDFTTGGPVYSDIMTDGSRGDSATVGPDGCLYATQTSTVLRVTRSDGTCALTPATAFPPDAVTGAASAVSETAATIAGTVDPNGYETTLRFEYGTDPGTLNLRTPDQTVGRGTDPVAVTASLGGLRAGTVYWFRVVATSSTGTASGTVAQFTTAAAAVAPTPTVLPKVTRNPLPASRRCVSRRRFTIRLRVPRGTRIARARVFLNGRRLAVRRSDRLRAVVNLRGLPKGRFKVRIALVLDDGRRVRGTRTYRTCVPGPRRAR